MRFVVKLAASAALLTALALAGAASADGLSAVAALGKTMFFDPSLSGSGAMSCAFCHDPANHYAPTGDAAVERGGPNMDRPGLRAVPTLTYKSDTPAFTIGAENPTSEAGEATPMAVAASDGQAEGNAAGAMAKLVAAMKARQKHGSTATAEVPRGGLFWDGRADTLQDQALGPLLSPFEMANTGTADLAAKFRKGYGAELAQLFGQQVLHDDAMLVDEGAFAIARFEVEDASFHPFSSKYDAFLAGKARLTPAETAGLKLFEDPKKGNCAACHLDRPSADGKPPMFTDYEYEALAVPRNPAIPANADPRYFDLGLCGPLRRDSVTHKGKLCGLFKTPTLRNVATRHVFFHNGIYRSLTDVVRFYALRDSDPGAIYPRGKDGRVAIYNDLPKPFWPNIDRIDAPFGRKPGDKPALSDAEIAQIVAFLNTLTDGWHP
ncbi:MAG: c-type cytochrome [Paracoccaceae bacterium]|nr:c-type cytochrome [Paracoccaceae bacterium]